MVVKDFEIFVPKFLLLQKLKQKVNFRKNVLIKTFVSVLRQHLYL
jgi:hypothetical protein